MHANGKNNQEIVGIINTKRANPSLHINSGRISEIINGQKGQDIPIATEDELTVKRLTKNNPTMAQKFAELENKE